MIYYILIIYTFQFLPHLVAILHFDDIAIRGSIKLVDQLLSTQQTVSPCEKLQLS